jgi:hypothetical protein
MAVQLYNATCSKNGNRRDVHLGSFCSPRREGGCSRFIHTKHLSPHLPILQCPCACFRVSASWVVRGVSCSFALGSFVVGSKHIAHTKAAARLLTPPGHCSCWRLCSLKSAGWTIRCLRTHPHPPHHPLQYYPAMYVIAWQVSFLIP